MISAYVSSEGIVVHSESNAMLITQPMLDDYLSFRTNPGRDELGYAMAYVYSLATLAQSAAGRVEKSGYVVHNPKINYEVGQQYRGKQLQNNPINGMIVKRAQGVLPYLYLDGVWKSGAQEIVLTDDVYEVLHVPTT